MTSPSPSVERAKELSERTKRIRGTQTGAYKLRQVSLDGEAVWKLTCPVCGVDGYIDDDQYHGRISTQCECGFHQTVNFAEVSP